MLALGIVAQVAIWGLAVQPQRAGSWFLAVLASVTCFGLGVRMLRRALSPLVLEAFRLQETAIGWEPGRALSVPAGPEPEPALHAVRLLRGQLLDRLQESRRLRVRAAQASEYKTGFLRSVQHELRTPLNAILGFADVLLSGIEGPLTAGQRENLNVIRQTGKRLEELFDEVVDLAAMAAGQVELASAAVDVAPLLERVVEGLEKARGDKPAHVRVDLAQTLPLVHCDAARVQRLLLGIGVQALSMLQGPLLVLSATAESSAVHLCVRDPTRTLTAEELRSLLGTERSVLRRKGSDEASRQRLAIWRQHAELLGGSLTLSSDERGTAYSLELPVAVSERQSG
ncbi:MAG: sensor histidine kinase [Polyangiales bacterium]